MPTHAEIADVVEKNYASGTCLRHRVAQQATDENIRAARFGNCCGAEPVEFIAETLQPLTDLAGPEIRAVRNDNARRFSAGVRVNRPNFL